MSDYNSNMGSMMDPERNLAEMRGERYDDRRKGSEYQYGSRFLSGLNGVTNLVYLGTGIGNNIMQWRSAAAQITYTRNHDKREEASERRLKEADERQKEFMIENNKYQLQYAKANADKMELELNNQKFVNMTTRLNFKLCEESAIKNLEALGYGEEEAKAILTAFKKDAEKDLE